MKIHQLPLGARFEYQGEAFVKTGPMSATGSNGAQRLIPKYAQLTVPGEAAPSGGKAGTQRASAVLEAFEVFYATCAQLVPEDRQTELEAARERFLKALAV